MSNKDDERLRKTTISFLKEFADKGYENAVECIDWLEKQGEQKSIDDLTPQEAMDIAVAKCFEQGEPKHHEYTLEQAAGIFLDALSNTPYNNKPITDAQFITKELLKFLDDASSYNPNSINEQAPTDKVEPKFKFGDKIRKKTPSSFDRDMQVARIEKDYYVCNHIGKFSSEVVPFSKESSYELIEQKPTWSDEDEEILNLIIARLHSHPNVEVEEYGKDYHWLKSLKERVQPQPKQEWSEKDEAVLDALIRRLEGEDIYVSPHLAAECLKSLRERYTWKPSDEQIIELRRVISGCSYDIEPLLELETKLKEF